MCFFGCFQKIKIEAGTFEVLLTTGHPDVVSSNELSQSIGNRVFKPAALRDEKSKVWLLLIMAAQKGVDPAH